VLVVMVPSADITLRPNAKKKPSYNKPWIINREIYRYVCQKEERHNRYGKLIRFLAKY
jgi:hypothetical protein